MLYRLKAKMPCAKSIHEEMPSFVRMNPQTWLTRPIPKGRTGKGVKVCVIGTGIVAHRSLTPSGQLANLGTAKHSRDLHGCSHMVAGLVAAKDSNNIVGMAPDATLTCVKASDDSGDASAEAIAAAALWAAATGADVAIISHALNFKNTVVDNAIRKAAECNVVVVIEEPLGCDAPDHVICANDYTLRLPEGRIMTLFTDNRYVSVEPTDVQVALVGGLVTLLAEKQVDKSPDEKRVHIVKRQLASLTG